MQTGAVDHGPPSAAPAAAQGVRAPVAGRLPDVHSTLVLWTSGEGTQRCPQRVGGDLRRTGPRATLPVMSAHVAAVGAAPPWEQLAVAQDGVLSRQQALAGGLSEDQWQWRLDSGRWQALTPGIVTTHTGQATAAQQRWAAVLVGGPGACLSGDGALVELGMRVGDPSVLHVAVPEGRSVRPRLLTSSVRVVPREVSALDRLRHPVRQPPTVRIATGCPARRGLGGQRTGGGVAGGSGRAAAPGAASGPPPGARRPAAAAASIASSRPCSTTSSSARTRPASWTSCASCVATGSRRRTGCSGRSARAGCATSTPGGSGSASPLSSTAPTTGTSTTWEDDLLRANDVLVTGRPSGTVLLRFTTGNLRHDGARVAGQLSAVLR